jgi:hypothetical protein
MSEHQHGIRTQKGERMKRQSVTIANNYRRLIIAVIDQAVKDNAIQFLKSDLCRAYCAAVGIDPAIMGAVISHNAGNARQGGENA